MRRIVFALALLGLLLTPAEAATIRASLTWTDVAGEDGYRVERRADPAGAYAAIGTVAAGVATFADAGLTPGAAYCWRVVAFNALGDGAPSNQACAATPATPPPPGGLSVTITVVP